MWEPSQATLDKDINGLVLLASAGCRFLASENTGRPCTSYVVERVPPQGAPYMGAQRYQAPVMLIRKQVERALLF